ncbi:Delta-1-pyrroline-5-carboxylate synthase 1, partial [Mucuna pruriens]
MIYPLKLVEIVIYFGDRCSSADLQKLQAGCEICSASCDGSDFRDKDFRKQLSETVKSVLALKVIPIFNENMQLVLGKLHMRFVTVVSSGIFWDNDSLSALLALELKADLILLSDVEGFYSGPPSEPNSKLIHTYIKEKHQNEITFGDKSRVGRGGRTAKVKASIHVAEAGIPVIITRCSIIQCYQERLDLKLVFAFFKSISIDRHITENIIKVLQGQRIRTLFHKDAQKWTPLKEVDACEMAVSARDCSRRLQRKQILLKIANALEAHKKEIGIENEADVAAAQEVRYEKSLVARLVLKNEKATKFT